MSKIKVRTGIEVLKADGFALLKGKRVGLMTNPSAVDAQMNSTVDILHQSEVVNLMALFGAEHGVFGAAADGESIDHAVEPRTGLIAHSLYGRTYRPTREMLAGLDAIVCDIQDVGARFYTFLWTISHILEAAGEHGLEVIILDRPNPLGGERIDGNGLEPECSSFVGRFDIPIQHGMTLGELALMLNDIWNSTPAKVTVVMCEGWERHMYWDDTGLPFVPTSPAMAHFSTALHYPGSCLIEGTTLSEGRGTVTPFEIIGAPYIDKHALGEHLNALNLQGVRWRPHTFRPSSSKHAGVYCEGVQAHILDRHTYSAPRAWLHAIHTIRHLYPDLFAWLPPHRNDAGGTVQHFDRLYGNMTARQQINTGISIDDLCAGWDAYHTEFRAKRAPYLQY